MADDRPRTRHEADLRRKEARQTAAVSRRWPLISGAVAVLLAAGLGAIIAYRGGNLPFDFDTEWMQEITENRSAAWEVPAQLLNTIGAGIFGVFVLPIVIIGVLCLLRRFWAALYFAVATVLSAGLVQLLKGIFARPRPEDILVTADLGSFPSGHVANAATMAVVLGFVVQRAWVWVAGVAYVVLMMLSRTYLGAHWASDTVGGLVLGVGVAIIAWAPLAHRLYKERRSRGAR